MRQDTYDGLMKAERLLAILTVLMDKKMVSASFLASRLEVSIRTIYRDIDALSAAGIPVFATTGRDGGFALVDGFKMSDSVLATGEIQHILTGLSGLAAIYQGPTLTIITDKLRTLLESSRQKGVPCPENHIFIELVPSKRDKKSIDSLRQSIEKSLVVSITYTDSSNQETIREIEPCALIYLWQSWYTWAWCRLRKDFRLFRITRIRDITILPYERESEPQDLSSKPWARQWETNPFSQVCFRAPKASLGRLYECFDDDYINAVDSQTVQVSANIPIDEWFISWIMGLPGPVTILEPESLAEAVQLRAKSFLEQR